MTEHDGEPECVDRDRQHDGGPLDLLLHFRHLLPTRLVVSREPPVHIIGARVAIGACAHHAAFAHVAPRLWHLYSRCRKVTPHGATSGGARPLPRASRQHARRRSPDPLGSFARSAGIDRSTPLPAAVTAKPPAPPRAETLVALSRATGASIDWLLGLSNDGPARTDIVREELSFRQPRAQPLRRIAHRVVRRINRPEGEIRPRPHSPTCSRPKR